MAHKDVFEESKFKIKVKLKADAKKDSDKAELFLKVDGVETSAGMLDVKKRWVEYEHTFAKVDDAKDNYPFSYRVTHDGENKLGDTTCTVWPRDANVKLVDVETGDEVAKTPFRLTFGGDKVQHFVSDDNGTSNCKLKHMALFTVQSTDDLTFHGWVGGKEHGRNREAKVERVEFLATLESPAWEGQKVEPYVNLATKKVGDEVGHDALGRKIKFNVKLRDKKSPNARINPKGGERVYVKATFGELTRRSAHLPTLESVSSLANNNDVITGYVSTANGKGSFTLALGFGGKETCKLQLGTTPACADVEVNFVNKRKLWVQKIAVAGKAVATSKAEGWLDKVAIELAYDTPVDFDLSGAGVGTKLAGACLGEKGDVFILGDHNVGVVTGLWTKEHDPHSAYVAFCDYQFDAGVAEMSKNVNFETSKRSFRCKAVNPKDSLSILSHSLHTGNFAVTGTWTSMATTGDHQGATGNIAEADVVIKTFGDPGHIKVNLPKAARDVVDAGEKVSVDLKVVYVKGDYNGWAPDPPHRGGAVIALKNSSGSRGVAGMNQTVVHELGHLINQVNAPPSAGITLTRRGDHQRNYTHRGHSGGHCANGISEKVYKGNGSLEGAWGTCVMFGEAGFFRKGEFCERCAPFVLAETLESLT